MPRPKATEPRDQTLLLRLSERQLEILQSVAHLERTSPNTYVHQLLVHHLASMVKNPRVQADLANRASYDQEAATTASLRGRPTAGEISPSASAERSRKRDAT